MRASGNTARNVYLKAINTSGSGEPQDLAFGTNSAYAASKGYVDAQVSATDSLQEVTTVGNTTTNSIMKGSYDFC